MTPHIITGRLVDLDRREAAPARVTIGGGRITAIEPVATADDYLLPGFVDAHVHIESSMMTPGEFARFAVRHGTVVTVSDPHEIANVLGVEGVRFMVASGRKTPFKFHWGVPSCVPATAFETAGARIGPDQVAELFDADGLGYLSEMMNYPGVIHDDPEVTAKLRLAKERGKPIDGHAPGLRGDAMRKYAAGGITTDHECVALDEALEKIDAGIKVLIREGSAAKNFEALHPLLKSHPRSCMLCTDDMHPDALAAGHINRIAARAVATGADVFDVIDAACRHPVRHYGLPVGGLKVGDPADFIRVRDLRDFEVLETWVGGHRLFGDGEVHMLRVADPAPNRFAARPVAPAAFAVRSRGGRLRVIVARDGQLVTDEAVESVASDVVEADSARDVLKITVVNRYADAPPAVAFIRGFGLKRGAIASSVAHDSHNVVAVGAKDDALAAAVNAVIRQQGGLAVADGDRVDSIALEVAGLMSRDGPAVAEGYARLDARAKSLGSTLAAPFMTLSFMALLVIPALKLSDRGLFDGRAFQFVEPFFTES